MDFLALVLTSKALGILTAIGLFGALGMSWLTKDVTAAYLVQIGILDANANLVGTRTFVAKTANYTVLASDAGTIFTNRGAAGAVTFTLPGPSPANAGKRYSFLGVASQNIIVSAGAGNGVAFNNAACTSLAMQTASQIIGCRIDAECDGTSWILTGVSVGSTYTVT